jgi:NOL1/NOP2/fmu family ribosome biogenesis protein
VNPLPFHERKALLKWMEERFGIPSSLFEDKALFIRGRDIWMTTHEAAETPLIQITRKGMRLARKDRYDYRLITPAIQYLGSLATRRIIDISPQEAERYIRGEDLSLPHLPPLPRGQVILRTHGRSLGSGLLTEKGVKNQIPVAHRVRKALEVSEER